MNTSCNTKVSPDQTKLNGIVDTAVAIVDSIWPNHSSSKESQIISLRTFINVIIIRSKTSLPVLQTALLYLLRVKLAGRYKHAQKDTPDYSKCGRRMLLASIIVASKFIQDRNCKNAAWAKATNSSVSEVNSMEMAFLEMIDYRLFVSSKVFQQWTKLLSNFTCAQQIQCLLRVLSCKKRQLSSPPATIEPLKSRFAPYHTNRPSKNNFPPITNSWQEKPTNECNRFSINFLLSSDVTIPDANAISKLYFE
ncbi:PHO85 cyclin-5 [Basidiobolus ranarum]|uniref:PHO85 cyclin-5 n=1 Tax=Basidiobolus ranarum TaxID=34480 RepID=A0ABR2WXC0_9FUNG